MSSSEVFIPLCGVYILLCPLRRFCPTLLGLYIIMSSSEVFVPLCGVYIIMSSSEVLSHFVGLIYYHVLFGGFCPTLWGLHYYVLFGGFVLTSVGFMYYSVLFGGFCPPLWGLCYYVLFGGFCPNVCWVNCSLLVCLATQGWIRGDNNLSAIASPCKN